MKLAEIPERKMASIMQRSGEAVEGLLPGDQWFLLLVFDDPSDVHGISNTGTDEAAEAARKWLSEFEAGKVIKHEPARF